MTQASNAGRKPFIVNMDVIQAYAELTQDFNPLHLDPEFAEKTAMQGVIAHGTMSLGLLIMQAFESLAPEAEALEFDVRFVSPVRPGDTPVVNLGEAGASGVQAVSVCGVDNHEYLKGTLNIK